MTPDFEATRRLFDLPEGVIYLDGNSRGPLPRSIEARLLGVIAKELGRMLICGWNQAGWMDKPCCDGDCIAGRQVGPPPVLQLARVDAALDVWDSVVRADLSARSSALLDQIISEVEASCSSRIVVSRCDHLQHGRQVSSCLPEKDAIMRAPISRGSNGDFRAIDILRFGRIPLFIGRVVVGRAVAILAHTMEEALWNRSEFRRWQAVT